MPINVLPETAKKVLNIIQDKLVSQCEKGYKKYGQSIDQAKGYDWNQMALEETIDGMQYLMKENMRLKSGLNNEWYIQSKEYQKKYKLLLEDVDNLLKSVLRGNQHVLGLMMSKDNNPFTLSLFEERYEANKEIATVLKVILEKQK